MAAWALAGAAVLGTVHGLFSPYWALGGRWLESTLGHQLVATFADRRWLLVPVAAVKVGFGALPMLLARSSRLGRVPWRMLCWAGAVVLMVWGGINTVIGNLVISGLLRHGDSYDRAAMVGHAWLWDPLFLIWGAAVTVALLLTRRTPGAAAGTSH